MAKCSLEEKIWVLAGNGSQWDGMAQELFEENNVFRGTLGACARVLQQHYGYDMLQHFDMGKGWGDPLSAAVGLTAIQIGLVNVLEKEYGIKPSGIIAHSAGKLATQLLYSKLASSPHGRINQI